ncbi:MAG: hypothetical protein FJ267_13810 [Planctomycetes bacterium]|nr:hypothetical protein [Planctomycetota bacterium]
MTRREKSGMMGKDEYPFVHAEGPPRELGRLHGSKAKQQIAGFLDFLSSSLRLSRESLRSRAGRFEPLFRQQCPHLLEEVDGLAEGAGIHRLDALAVQMRGELNEVQDEACTALAVSRGKTSDREILIGQNSDNPPELKDYGYVLRLAPIHGPRMLMWTFGGMIGYHGLNQSGVAHFANALGGGPRWKFALSHYPLKRLILEQTSLNGVRQVMSSVPVCSNGNYVLCDGTGEITDIELTSEGPFEIGCDEEGIVVHSNHYRCSQHAREENFACGLPDSFDRLDRMTYLLRLKSGQLTLDDLKGFFADHLGFPLGICRHTHSGSNHAMLSNRGHTVASLIAQPDQGLLHVSRGNPCENRFVTYRLFD